MPVDDPHSIVLTPTARRALSDTLPSAAASAAWEFINGPLAERPRGVGAALRSPYEGLWRANRGEYRVRYRNDDDSRTVVVIDIDHRRSAYHS